MKSKHEILPRLRESKANTRDHEPKFLGRLSWQKDLLEVPSVSDRGAFYSLGSPNKKESLSISSPSLETSSPTRRCTLLNPVCLVRVPQSHHTDHSSASIGVVPSKIPPSHTIGGTSNSSNQSTSTPNGIMTYEESMQEVEKMLEDFRQPQRKRAARGKGLNTTNRKLTFEFMPLQNLEVLRDSAELDDQDCDNSNDNDEDEMSSDTMHGNRKYFGRNAKAGYYKVYHELHSKSHLFVEKPTIVDSLNTPTNDTTKSTRRLALQPAKRLLSFSSAEVSSPSLHSPRVLFLADCIAKSHPAISMVLRKENTHKFDFSHQGLGDEFMISFAACLLDLPYIEDINVTDNRLSDHAIHALLLALEHKPNLTKLDISENEIGQESAKALRTYVSSSLCTVKTLVMNEADVDDRECALFMIAFELNRSVERLMLRSNRIGQARKSVTLGSTSELEVSSGKLPTGGEAIGSMLNVNLTIQELDLSWNMIRYNSCAPIANSLHLNYNLRDLNLSYNCCGDDGAMALGHALRINSSLQKLNLAYNSIGSRGGMVLASGLVVNKGLRELVLDGNPIGAQSGREIIHASCARIHTPTVCILSMFECDLTSPDTSTTPQAASSKNTKVYNPTDPVGTYNLNLSDPYEQMIAHELLRLAAFKKGYRFSKLEFSNTPGPSSSTTKIELSRRLTTKPTAIPTTPASPISESSQLNPLTLLFNEIDKDHSGCVDLSELAAALQSHGITVSDELLERILKEYDYDNSGTLTQDEFEDFFLRCGFEVIDADHSGALNEHELGKVVRLMGFHDLSDREIRSMMAQYDVNNSGEIDEQEFIQFMKAEILHHENTQVTNHESAQSAEEAAKVLLDEAYERSALRDSTGAIWKVPSSGFLTIDFILDEIIENEDDGSNGGVTESGMSLMADSTISTLLTNVQSTSSNSSDQNDFLHTVLEQSDLLFTAVQAETILNKQGALKSWSRKLHALEHILPQMANREEAVTIVNRLLDPSKQWEQRWSLRRTLGKVYTILLGSLTNRYRYDLLNSNDRIALKRMALLAQEEKVFSKNRSGRGDTSQNGNWENFRNATVDGVSSILTSTFILNTLLSGTNISALDKAALDGTSALKTVVHYKRRIEFDYVSTTRAPRGMRGLTARRFEQLIEVWTNNNTIVEEIPSDAVPTTGQEKDKSNTELHWNILRNYVFSMRRASSSSKQKCSLAGHFKSTLNDIQRKLELLEILISERWFVCEQVSILIGLLPNAVYARARAACLLFARVIDIENFIHIYDSLSLDDQRECVKRLGWLNIFDPLQPDRQYSRLDLSVRDERELVQILSQLALIEGIQCWKNASLRASVATPTTVPTTQLPMPGWGNPNAIGEESLKHQGVVQLRYDTKASKANSETMASNMESRKNLRKKVLSGTRLFLQ